MKHTLDRSPFGSFAADFDDDPRFEDVWRDLPDDDGADYAVEADRNDVRLECDGDFVNVTTVETLEVQEVVAGADLVRFRCPHCGEAHESLCLR